MVFDLKAFVCKKTTFADFESEIWKVFDTGIYSESLRCTYTVLETHFV